MSGYTFTETYFSEYSGRLWMAVLALLTTAAGSDLRQLNEPAVVFGAAVALGMWDNT